MLLLCTVTMVVDYFCIVCRKCGTGGCWYDVGTGPHIYVSWPQGVSKVDPCAGHDRTCGFTKQYKIEQL